MDFRSWIAQNGDSRYLAFTGNDGQIDRTKPGYDTSLRSYLPTAGNLDLLQGKVNQYYDAYNRQNNGVLGASWDGSSVSSAADKTAYGDFTNRAYDTKISGLRALQDTLNPQEEAARLNVQNQWTNQQNTLQGQKAIGERNLNMAGEQVETQKVKSLADLNRQIQTMGMSYNNQLGSYGAGDSSASQMIQQALSGQASKNRAGVMGSASDQQTQIGLQKGDLNLEFENNMKSLDDWKSTSLNDIATKFMQQRQAIQQQMQGADADRYQALAQLDANYVNRAMQALTNLEGQYKTASQDLVGRYQSMQGPQVAIPSHLQQFAVNPISAGRIASMSATPQQNSGNTVTPYAQRHGFDEDYGFGI